MTENRFFYSEKKIRKYYDVQIWSESGNKPITCLLFQLSCRPQQRLGKGWQKPLFCRDPE